MGKVSEKVIADKFSPYCKTYSKLNFRQIDGLKERLAIIAIATIVYTIHKKWEEIKLITTFFMDIKGVVDHVSKRQLFNQIIELDIHNDFLN